MNFELLYQTTYYGLYWNGEDYIILRIDDGTDQFDTDYVVGTYSKHIDLNFLISKLDRIEALDSIANDIINADNESTETEKMMEKISINMLKAYGKGVASILSSIFLFVSICLKGAIIPFASLGDISLFLKMVIFMLTIYYNAYNFKNVLNIWMEMDKIDEKLDILYNKSGVANKIDKFNFENKLFLRIFQELQFISSQEEVKIFDKKTKCNFFAESVLYEMQLEEEEEEQTEDNNNLTRKLSLK